MHSALICSMQSQNDSVPSRPRTRFVKWPHRYSPMAKESTKAGISKTPWGKIARK